MALIKCPECKKEMSNKANSCPHCGFSKPESKGVGCGSLILLAIVISVLMSVCSPDKKTSVPEKPKTPEEQREEQIKSAFSPWDGSHRNLEKYVKEHLKDPDSYQHIETRYGDRGNHIFVSMKYRAKNSFGGYVVEIATATTEIDGTLISVDMQN